MLSRGDWLYFDYVACDLVWSTHLVNGDNITHMTHYSVDKMVASSDICRMTNSSSPLCKSGLSRNNEWVAIGNGFKMPTYLRLDVIFVH